MSEEIKQEWKTEPNPGCPYCQGTGKVHVPDGDDDYIEEQCDCVNN